MKIKIIFCLLSIFLFVNPAFSFETKVLPNGQMVIVQQIKNNPIVIIDTWVKTGSINENDKNNGVSHFLEHLLFKGSKKYSTGVFDKILESKGAMVNAATSKDFTHFYIQIPSKYFDTALDLHSDMLLAPSIPEGELAKERKVVIEEISKDLNSPEHKVYENFVKAMYKCHPYKRQVIGTKEIIQNISRDEILEYYNKYYIPQNMVTVIVGDVEPKTVFKKVEQKFTGNKSLLKKNINPNEPSFSNQTIQKTKMDVKSGYLMLGYRGADIKNKDTYALDVLSTILGSGRSSVFYKNIKEDRQLAFDIDVVNSTYKEDGMFYVSADFSPEKYDQLVNAIYSEIDNIISNGVSENQIKLAKKILNFETKYSRESVESIASQIGYTTTLFDSTEFYDKYLANINSVTAQDIKNVAVKYLQKDKSIISVVLPAKEPMLSKKSEQKKYNSKCIKKSENVSKFILDNGATLLTNKNNSNDIIAISILAKGGNFLEEVPGTSDLTSTLMLKGTKKYTKDKLAQLMEENGIKIIPQASSDTFEVNIVTTNSQLETTLEILDEIVNNAVFNQEEIDKIKLQKVENIKKSEDIPINKALEPFREMIYGDSAYSIANKRFLDNYKKISRSNILNYYKKIFSSDNLIISINGNADTKLLVNSFSKMFKKGGVKFAFDENKIPYIEHAEKSVKYQKDLGTAWVFTGWQTCGIKNEKDYATLNVINSLLGSGMSSRLFVDLREKEGLAYQVGSSFSPKYLRGAFIMYIGTNPQTLDKSKSMLISEVEKLKNELVSQSELKEAKEKLLGRYILSHETNLDKAAQTAWYEATDRGFDYESKYENAINSVSSEDIMRVAKKYFKLDNIITSEVRKEEK